MSSTTLLIQEVVIRTGSVATARCCEICLPLNQQNSIAQRPILARWAVTTDEHGQRQLSMRWRVDPRGTQ
jgi:hypothetical protein